MLASLWFFDPQLRVSTAFPVDDQHNLTGCVIHIGDNVLDQGPEQVGASHAALDPAPSRSIRLDQRSRAGLENLPCVP